MDADLLTRLQAASSDEEREWLLLELSLSRQGLDVEIVTAAAIPHWFDRAYLAAVLEIEPDELTSFATLTDLSFVEIYPGRGFNIHERTRHLLLKRLWQSEPDRYRELSCRAAAHCAQQDQENREWRIESIYHLLGSESPEGIDQLRTTGLLWRNFPYNAYDQVENLVRVAQEQAQRQTGEVAGWTRFWEAQVDWLYGRFTPARQKLEQLTVDPNQDLALAAERNRALAALYAEAGEDGLAQATYQEAFVQFRQLGQTQTVLILMRILRNKGWYSFSFSDKSDKELIQIQGDDNRIVQQEIRGDNNAVFGQVDGDKNFGERNVQGCSYLWCSVIRQKLLENIKTIWIEKVLVKNLKSFNMSSQMPPERKILLENIKTTWIDGVLDQSLQHEIALAMEQTPQMVGQAVSMTLHTSGQMDQTLPAGMPIEEVWGENGLPPHPTRNSRRRGNRSLLILGDPGSGKTMTLLQLLRALLAEANANPDAPVPLLFNLSSWGRREEAFSDWLVEEAFLQYQIGRKYMRDQFLPDGNYILLLDGLDEVPLARRNDCVQTINNWLAEQAQPPDVVVCSRIADYQALQNRLHLDEAILLRPLTATQIDQYLTQAAADEQTFAAVRRLLQTDKQMGQLARSPLLLNILMLTYRDAETIDLGTGESAATKRKNLFAHYVQKALHQIPLSEDGYTQAEVTRWLTYLAQTMQSEGNSLFYLEEMQPDRLGRWAIHAYRALYSGAVGLSVGLILRLDNGLSNLILYSMSSMFSMILSTVLSGRIQRNVMRLVTTAIISWLIFGVSIALMNTPLSITLSVQSSVPLSTTFSIPLGISLVFGLIGGTGVFLSGGLVGWRQRVLVRERIRIKRPSRQRLFSSLKHGVKYGLIFGLASGLIYWLVFRLIAGLSNGLSRLIFGLLGGLMGGLILALIFGLIGGLSGGVIGGVLAFIDVPSVNKRTRPGQGITRSLGNGFFMLIIAGLLLGYIGVLLDTLFNRYGIFRLLVVSTFLPITFLYYGGLAYLQHYALRLVLAVQKRLPFRLVRFLNAMTQRVLLRRIGGGYIFIHRALLEYFAALDTD